MGQLKEILNPTQIECKSSLKDIMICKSVIGYIYTSVLQISINVKVLANGTLPKLSKRKLNERFLKNMDI